MNGYFRNFFKHSFIYGIGNAINRGASFLLIPLYTRVLSTSEYGALEMFYVIASVLGILLGMNIAHGTLRFYFEFDEESERKKVVGTSLLVTLALCLSAYLVLIHFTDELSRLVFRTSGYRELLPIVFIIVLMQLSNEIAFAFLRVKERSLQYIAIAGVQLVCQVGLNLYTVLVLKLGIKGILVGNLLSNAVVWLILTAMLVRYSGVSFDMRKLRLLAGYCLPFVLSAFAGIAVNNADRIMLNAYASLSAVGIYALGMKFGIAVRDLIVEPFFKNFGQSRFAIMNQPEAKRIYARTLTYFVFIVVFISLGVSLYAREVIVVISSPDFRSAHTIVPIMLLSVLFTGMGYIYQTGILVRKKTKYIFYITMSSAVAVLALNRLLIPLFGMYGAASSAALNALFVCGATYFVSQSLLPVDYEFTRLAKILASGVCLFGISLLFPSTGFVAVIAAKLALLSGFPLLLYLAGFFSAEEKLRIREFGGAIAHFGFRVVPALRTGKIH